MAELTAGAEAAPKKGRALLIIVVVNVIAVGGAGAWLLTRNRAAAAAPVGPDKPPLGKLVPLESYIVNLNEAKATRYLKVTFSLELGDESVEPAIAERKDVIRDRILTYLSGLTVDDVRGSETKEAIRLMLARRTNEALGTRDAVKSVLFTEFVVQ